MKVFPTVCALVALVSSVAGQTEITGVKGREIAIDGGSPRGACQVTFSKNDYIGFIPKTIWDEAQAASGSTDPLANPFCTQAYTVTAVYNETGTTVSGVRIVDYYRFEDTLYDLWLTVGPLYALQNNVNLKSVIDGVSYEVVGSP
ncbi:hypothetical protein BT69DRAFT_1317200 [Atractiella rhizophila]|nr:hypothetical protein BT69DRAFT_1317200 [Atractiella rhizophila]